MDDFQTLYTQTTSDPDWKGLPPVEQRKVIQKLLLRDNDFVGMPPVEQMKVRNRILSQYPDPPKTSGGEIYGEGISKASPYQITPPARNQADVDALMTSLHPSPFQNFGKPVLPPGQVRLTPEYLAAFNKHAGVTPPKPQPASEQAISTIRQKYLQPGDKSEPAMLAEALSMDSPKFKDINMAQLKRMNPAVQEAVLRRAAELRAEKRGTPQMYAPQTNKPEPSNAVKAVGAAGTAMETLAAPVKYLQYTAEQKYGPKDTLPGDVAEQKRLAKMTPYQRMIALRDQPLRNLGKPESEMYRQRASEKDSIVGRGLEHLGGTAAELAINPVTYGAGGLGSVARGAAEEASTMGKIAELVPSTTPFAKRAVQNALVSKRLSQALTTGEIATNAGFTTQMLSGAVQSAPNALTDPIGFLLDTGMAVLGAVGLRHAIKDAGGSLKSPPKTVESHGRTFEVKTGKDGNPVKGDNGLPLYEPVSPRAEGETEPAPTEPAKTVGAQAPIKKGEQDAPVQSQQVEGPTKADVRAGKGGAVEEGRSVGEGEGVKGKETPGEIKEEVKPSKRAEAKARAEATLAKEDAEEKAKSGKLHPEIEKAETEARGRIAERRKPKEEPKPEPEVKAEEPAPVPKTEEAKEPWGMTRKEYAAQRKAELASGEEKLLPITYHKGYVVNALNEGKPVPKEVLADYPELAKPPSTPLTPEQSARAALKQRGPTQPKLVEVPRTEGYLGPAARGAKAEARKGSADVEARRYDAVWDGKNAYNIIDRRSGEVHFKVPNKDGGKQAEQVATNLSRLHSNNEPKFLANAIDRYKQNFGETTIPRVGLVEGTQVGAAVRPQPGEPGSVADVTKRYRDRGIPPLAAEKNAQALVNAIERGQYGDIVHPSNKHSRAIFEEVTGIKLPKGAADTRAVFKGESLLPETKTRGTVEEVKTDEPSKPTTTKAEEPTGVREVRPDQEREPSKEPTRPVSATDEGRSTPATSKERERTGDKSDGGDGGRREELAGGVRGSEREVSPGTDAERTREREPVATNYAITPEDAESFAKTTNRQKLDNINAALKTLKKIEAEGRLATPEEQAALVKFPGWGWTGNALHPKNAGGYEYRLLTEHLTPEERVAAEKATQNSHYTSPEVINGIYDALRRLGFTHGKALEPSAGIGHFIGLLPDDMRGQVNFRAIEKDSLTARILKQLYPRSAIDHSPYEKVRLPSDHFDLAISNVPFGAIRIHDPEFVKQGGNPEILNRIHNYFFAKAMDQVRPGGIMGFITSHGTLDARDTAAVATRERLADKGNFLGAIRLPNTAFKSNAGTEVTTDILFFQKKGPGVDDSKSQPFRNVVEVPAGDAKALVNEYFQDNPEMVLGEHSMEGSMRRENEYTLKPREGDLKEHLDKAIDKLPENVYTQPTRESEMVAAERAETKKVAAKRAGALHIEGNKVAVHEGDGTVKNINVETADLPVIKSFTTVRDALSNVISAMKAGQSETEIKALQKTLDSEYKSYVKKHGPLNGAKRDAWLSDPDSYTVLSLEHYDPKTRKVESLAPIFDKMVIRPSTEPTTATTAKDALVLSLRRFAGLNIDEMGKMLGSTPEKVSKELSDAGLIYNDPKAGWVTADEYGSGNVRAKLAEAKAAGLEDHAKFLETVQPRELKPGEIRAKIGAGWIPQDVHESFLAKLLGTHERNVDLTYNPFNAKWGAKGYVGYGSVESRATWGTSRRSAVELFEDALNGRMPEIKDKVEDSYVLNKSATDEARAKLDAIKDEWDRWIYEDPTRADRLANKYNTEVNVYTDRKFDGSHLTFPGQNPMMFPKGLRAHQKNAVWRILQGLNTLLAHDVGTGKTATMVTAAMELRRTGIGNKPMIVVKKSGLQQMARDFKTLYPGAKLLVADEDTIGGKRREFMGRVATGDWDSVILTHDALKMLPIHPDTVERFYNDEISKVREFLYAAKDGGDANTVKEVQKHLDNLEAKWETRREKLKELQDQTIFWDDLGVDRLFIDEAHKYKKLAYASQFPTMGDAGSDFAFDLFMKSSEMQKNGGSLVFATGTPLTNSVSEMHGLMRFLAPDILKAHGEEQFDAWARNYVTGQSDLEPDVSGRYKNKFRFSSFSNVPEMMQQYRSVADVVHTEDVPGIERPRLTDREGNFTDKPVMVETGVNPAQLSYFEHMVARADAITYPIEKGGDNVLSISTDGRHVSLDARTRIANAPDYADSKVNKLVKEVLDVHNDPQHTKDKRTQLIFMDLGVPKSKGFDLYADIKAKLIKGGVKPNEIAFIQDATTDARKEAIQQAVRDGKIRVMLGSREMMGVGLNVQDRLIAVHQVDPPWRPDQLEQSNGRILRQGMIPEFREKGVRIYNYVTKGSYDEFMWNKVSAKDKFIKQVTKGDVDTREIEDISGDETFSYAEMQAAASGNPKLGDLIKTTAEVKKLKGLQQTHQNNVWDMTRDANRIKDVRIPIFDKEIQSHTDAAKFAEANKQDAFSMKVGSEKFEGNEQAVYDQVYNKLNSEAEKLSSYNQFRKVGEYNGFDVNVSQKLSREWSEEKQRNVETITHTVTLSVPKGTGIDYTSGSMDLTSGIVSKMNHAIRGIPSTIKSLQAERLAQIERGKKLNAEAAKPFAQMDKLKASQERMAELQKEVGVDLVDGQKQQGWGKGGVTAGLEEPPSITDKLRAAEEAATERLRTRERGLQSGIDPEDLKDLAIVGGAKLARGTIELAKWGKEMVDEFGEWVRPHLEAIYDAAKSHYEQEFKKYGESKPGKKKPFTILTTETPEPEAKPAGPPSEPPKEPPVKIAEPEGRTTGIAERVRHGLAEEGRANEYKPGEGASPEEMKHIGRQAIASGIDPEQHLSMMEKRGESVSGSDMAILSAHDDALMKAADQARDAMRAKPNDLELKAAAKEAAATEKKWYDRISKYRTEWQKIGTAQQGEVDVDTGSFTSMQRYFEKTNNRPLEEGESAIIQAHVDRIKELEETLAKRDSEIADKVQQTSTNELEADVQNIAKTTRKAARNVSKTALDAEFKGFRDELKDIASRMQASRAQAKGRLSMGWDPTGGAFDEVGVSELYHVFRKMAANRLNANINLPLKGLIEEIHAEVKDIFEGMTKEHVRDIMSGYGLSKQPSQKQPGKQLRELTTQARLVRSIEDVEAKLRPMKSGPQRDIQTETVRLLRQQLRDSMRKTGQEFSSRTSAQQIASRLDSTKTSLKNQVADKIRLINEGVKRPGATPLKPDADILGLRGEVEDLNSIIKELDKASGATDQAAIERAIAAVDKANARKRESIKTGNVEPQRATSSPWSKRLGELKIEAQRLDKQTTELRKAGRPQTDPQVKRIEMAIKRTQNAIDNFGKPRTKVTSSPWSKELSDLKMKLEQLKATADPLEAIRKHANRYINQTNPKTGRKYESADVFSKVASDLGISSDDVRYAFTQNKTVSRVVTDQMYAEQSAKRQMKKDALAYVENANKHPVVKTLNALPSLWRSSKVFGHGTVGMTTHGGPNLFMPFSERANYWPGQVKQLAMGLQMGKGAMGRSEVLHEQMLRDIENHPLYDTARRGGLKVDTYRIQDDIQDYARFLAGATTPIKRLEKPVALVARLSKRGDMGMDVLKWARMKDFAQKWDQSSIKTPDMAKELSNWVNHAWGSSDTKLGKPGGILFSPSLQGAHWARVIGDPAKTLSTYADIRFNKGRNTTPEKAAVAKMRMKRAAEFAGVYGGVLLVNQAMLKANGQKDDVNFFNPTSSDWMQPKWNGRTLAMGLSQGPIHVLSQVARDVKDSDARRLAQDVFRYGQGKLHPALGTALEVGMRKDYFGRPLPFASKEMKDKAIATGRPDKQPISTSEYLWTLSPIPVEGIAREYFESMRDNGANMSETLRMWNAFKAAGESAPLELMGVRIGHTPKPYVKQGKPKTEEQREKAEENRFNKSQTFKDREPVYDE